MINEKQLNDREIIKCMKDIEIINSIKKEGNGKSANDRMKIFES